MRLWQPHILSSLTALEDEHRAEGRSLGIIQPDPASLKFFWRDAEQEDQDDTRGVQASLFEAASASIPFLMASWCEPEKAVYTRSPT